MNSNNIQFDKTPFLASINNELNDFNLFGIERKENVLNIAKNLIIKPTDEIKPPIVAIKINDGVLGTLGNFSMITGKAKSRKSFFLNLLATSLITNNNTNTIFTNELPNSKRKVLFFDTEQGSYHVQLALHRICKLSGVCNPSNLIVVGLRSKKPSERLEIIEQMIYDTENLGYVFIDGIKDLLTSINDEEQATMIASKLLKWTEDLNIHISVVLHQNKSDTNARGHIGTELINKAETVLSISRETNNKEVSVMIPEQCRNKEPEPIAFEIVDGLPKVIDNYSFTTSAKERYNITKLPIEQINSILDFVYSNNDSFTYTELTNQIVVAFSNMLSKTIGTNKAKEFITECKNQKYLVQPKERGKYFFNKEVIKVFIK